MDKKQEEKEIKRILQYEQATFDGKCKSIVDLMEKEKQRVALEAVEWLEEKAIDYVDDTGQIGWNYVHIDFAKYIEKRISANDNV